MVPAFNPRLIDMYLIVEAGHRSEHRLGDTNVLLASNLSGITEPGLADNLIPNAGHLGSSRSGRSNTSTGKFESIPLSTSRRRPSVRLAFEPLA
jgi:hypothetical protein